MLQISQEYQEKLFAKVYQELRQRSSLAQDDDLIYNQLNIARLIRQMLIDGNPLLSQVNYYHRVPIQFIIPTIGPATGTLQVNTEIYSKYLPDLGNYPPGYYLRPYRLSGFLDYSPIILSDRAFSVIEIIKYVCNSFGGVHLSNKLINEDDQLLARFNDFLKVGKNGVILHAVEQIGLQTLLALMPLMKIIEDKYKNERP